MNFNRRNLLKGGAAAVASLPFASAIAKPYSKDIRWDKETDVLVVGYGGAGACAAITAHDAGAKVLIVEKMKEGGGNTAVSSGGFMIPKNEADALTYLNATYDFADSEKDPELLKVFCKEIMGVKSFMEGLKPDTKLWVYGHAGFQNLKGWEAIDKWRVRGKKRGGDCLFDLYRYAVEENRRIPIMLNTAVKQLIKNGDEVVGVVAVADGKEINIKAKRAVILACGGYEFDQESLTTFAQGHKFHALGNPGNTGDGVRLAQSAGARLWHMTAYSCPLGCELPGCKAAMQIQMMSPSFIWVDQDGKRFCDEFSADGHIRAYMVNRFDPITHRYPYIPCYVVFDDVAFKRGPIGSITSGYSVNREGYKWSFDNSKEVASGVIKKADSLKELAKIIGVPAENLEASVKKWNEDVKAGKDTQFARPIHNPHKSVVHIERKSGSIVSAPLTENGPYYAIVLYPTMLNTQGGPKKDVNGHVMTPENKPVPRLYAAGELGSMWGNIYQGATNNAECIVFGRLAGRAAAAEKSWS